MTAADDSRTPRTFICPKCSRAHTCVVARDTVKLVIGGVFLLIFAGLVEGFISHSTLPKPLKITFGIASGVALYSYLLLAGREKPGEVAANRGNA